MTLRSLALIAIGRNEGPRLERCLDSLSSRAEFVIDVDSGSTDGSVAQALARESVCAWCPVEMRSRWNAHCATLLDAPPERSAASGAAARPHVTAQFDIVTEACRFARRFQH